MTDGQARMGWVFHLEIVVSKADNHSIECNLSLPVCHSSWAADPALAAVLVIDNFHSNQDFHCLMKSVETVKLLIFFTKKAIFNE